VLTANQGPAELPQPAAARSTPTARRSIVQIASCSSRKLNKHPPSRGSTFLEDEPIYETDSRDNTVDPRLTISLVRCSRLEPGWWLKLVSLLAIDLSLGFFLPLALAGILRLEHPDDSCSKSSSYCKVSETGYIGLFLSEKACRLLWFHIYTYLAFTLIVGGDQDGAEWGDVAGYCVSGWG
jgi:hypothetical protein